jgi:tetratricopeptide (TPR) repeat protein
MRIILLFGLAISFNTFSQGKAQKDLERDFVDEYCNCLQKFSSDDPGKILYSATETCVKNFFSDKDRIKEIEQAVKETEADASLSDYEKGRIVGKEIMYNTIDDLVKNCKFYRKTLTEYKSIIMGQLKITRESADSSIADFISKEGSIKDEKSKATYFSLLGIMYEFVGNKKKALNCYEKSLNAYPTTQAKGLRLLLRME